MVSVILCNYADNYINSIKVFALYYVKIKVFAKSKD